VAGEKPVEPADLPRHHFAGIHAALIGMAPLTN
jgi:hypothetical protein